MSFWNITPREQVIGRAIRYHSHPHSQQIQIRYINITKFRYTKIINSELYSELECAICFNGKTDNTDNTNKTNKWCELSCEHKYHMNCISPWISRNTTPTCPICRKKLIHQ